MIERVSALVARLSNLTGIPEQTVRSIARQLMDDGILPKCSGRRFEVVGFDGAAKLLVACLASPVVADASRTVDEFDAQFSVWSEAIADGRDVFIDLSRRVLSFDAPRPGKKPIRFWLVPNSLIRALAGHEMAEA